MNLSSKNIPDPTKVPDDMLALQRKRIADGQPGMDYLLAAAMKKPADDAMLPIMTEGLVKMTETVKILSLAIHEVRQHPAPLSACQDEFCQVLKRQIDGGVALIATASEVDDDR